MTEKERHFVTVGINNLCYPILIGQKSRLEGNNTLVRILVKADIENKFEPEFESRLDEIMSDRKSYSGPMQLISRLISYINSINSRKFIVNLRYPLFLAGRDSVWGNKHLQRYNCGLSVCKTSLINYKQSFKVEIPVVYEQFIIPGIQKEILNIPVKIVVGIEGFENIFAEDIIETVEEAIYGNHYNLTSALSNDIKKYLLGKLSSKFFNQYNIDSCSVKLMTRKLSHRYSAEISAKNIPVKIDDKFLKEHLIK